MESNFPLIRLSQGHLNLLEICPPKFQQVYLEQLSSLPNLEQQEKQTWGSRFHLLMQQRELGLPIESLLQEDEELKHSLIALIQAAPEIFLSECSIWREAEHCRTMSFGNYLLTVIYDLLIADEQKAKILDWKTYLQPQNKTKLATNWQTRLYLYVLAETSEYLPEQISMTYWFIKLPTKPKSLTFSYSQAQHEKTKQDLTHLLTDLDNWLKTYRDRQVDFPHYSNCEESCPFYQSLLSSQISSTGTEPTKQNDLTSIKDIEEVAL
ncbi:PD-(D/E)XK nuclease family protein [Pleurocapsales cyanobacterium LEGE 06147]|nr:PD-(D/E)XK nuclease family protein [Pleurocapsales cyanobacterium LEGE 06147]